MNVKLSSIYEKVYDYEKKEVSEYNKAHPSETPIELTDEDHRFRVYRRKFNQILDMFGCNKKNFKDETNQAIVPIHYEAIIETLLKEATKKTSYTSKWLCGNIGKFTSEEIVNFFEHIESLFNNLIVDKQTQPAYAYEFLSALNTMIDYSSAKMIVEMKQFLEKFRITALPLMCDIQCGELSYSDEFGFKYILHEGKKRSDYTNCFETDLPTKNDYMCTLRDILQKFNEHAQVKAYEFMKNISKIKVDFDCYKIPEDYLEPGEMFSAYVARDTNIQNFLTEHPQIVNQLQKELNTTDLMKYYKFIKTKESVEE